MALSMLRNPRGLLALSLALVFLLAVACGDEATPTRAPTNTPAPTDVPATAVPTPTEAPAMMEPVENRLVVAITIERESNDPTLASTVNSAQYIHMYEALVRYDKDGLSEPMLATEWEFSDDLLTWTFKLRKGVEFHKGFGEFTAADVVESHKHFAREESITSLKGFYADDVVPDFEVVDDYTVVYHLSEPRTDLDWIENNRNQDYMMSSAHLESEGQEGIENNPIGTAPYQYVSRELGSHILFERVPYDHWRQTPDFPELQMNIVAEPATKLAMLLAEEVHMVQLPPDLEKTAVDQGYRVISSEIPMINHYTFFGGNFHPEPNAGRKGTQPDLPYSDMYYDSTKVPWVDVRIREALNRAVDRDELQATILGGKGERMMVNPYHRTLPGWNDEWEERFDEMYGYDPERAKELIAEVEAELGGPIDWSNMEFLLTILPEAPHVINVGQAVLGYWQEIGVDIPSRTDEFANFVAHIIDGSVGGVAWTDGTKRWEEPSMIGIFYYSGRTLLSRCCHFFESERVDDLYEQLIPELDLDERDRLLREAGNYLFDNYATVPLFSLPMDFTINPNVIENHISSGIWGIRDLEYAVAVKK